MTFVAGARFLLQTMFFRFSPNNPVSDLKIVEDAAYSSLALFQATFVTCFLPVLCLSLSCFFVFVLFHWKEEDFLTNSLISNKIFAFCIIASA